MKKIISLLLALVLCLSVIAIAPMTSASAVSYRDSIIEAVLDSQSSWVPGSFWYDMGVAGYGFCAFSDINFDGKPEFIVGYPTGSMRDHRHVVYYCSGGKLKKATGGNYTLDKSREGSYFGYLDTYYNKKSGTFRKLGYSLVRSGLEYVACFFGVSFDGKKIYTKYYTAEEHDYNYQTRKETIKYFNGGTNWENMVGKKKLTKAQHDKIIADLKANTILVQNDTEGKNAIKASDWKNASTSTKRNLLQKAYDSASYEKLFKTPKVTAIKNVENGVKIAWSKDANVVKTRIFRKNPYSASWSKLADVKGTSYVDKNVVSGNDYAYTVRGITADGKIYITDFVKTGTAIKYLAMPKVAKFESINGGVKLTISKSGGVNNYRVFLKAGSEWKTLGYTKNGSFFHKTNKSGKTYVYTVRAIAEDGSLSAYSASGYAHRYLSAPASKAIKNTANGIRYVWKRVDGAKKYRVFRKTGSSSWQKLADVAATKDYILDKTAKNGVTYSYTVRCVNGSLYESGFDAGATITCKR